MVSPKWVKLKKPLKKIWLEALQDELIIVELKDGRNLCRQSRWI